MKELHLTKGKVALVDDKDFTSINARKWQALKNHRTWYAQSTFSSAGKKQTVKLHRHIIGALPGLEVDHINGDGLDCQRKNLRIVTTQMNSFNRRARAGSSIYKGVCAGKTSGSWRAQIKANGKNHHIGQFASEIEAAKAYDKKAGEFYGVHAYLNFPDSIPSLVVPTVGYVQLNASPLSSGRGGASFCPNSAFIEEGAPK